MNEKIAQYFIKHHRWKEILQPIRSIMLEEELEESYKWNSPVYMYSNKNIIGLGAFKNHCCIWFFNGVLLKDKHNLFVKAKDSTKSMRQMRFEMDSVTNLLVIREYVLETIENQKKTN